MAAEPIGIIREPLDGEARGFILDVTAFVDVADGSGDLVMSVEDEAHENHASATIRFAIANPLFTSALASAISAFAACVAAGLAGVGASTIHTAYSESKKANPKMSRSDRCSDVITRLRASGTTIKAGASAAVASCLTTIGLS